MLYCVGICLNGISKRPVQDQMNEDGKINKLSVISIQNVTYEINIESISSKSLILLIANAKQYIINLIFSSNSDNF